MARRHLTTAVTLAVLCGLLVLGAVVGFNALFAPLPKSSSEPVAAPSPSCTLPQVKKGQKLRSSQVTVSVFNAGSRDGLASDTLDEFRARGFQLGEAGNAPAGAKVRRAQVWIVKGEEDAGRLVAKQLGANTQVLVKPTKQDPSTGIDVIVGNEFVGLRDAPKFVIVRKTPVSTC